MKVSGKGKIKTSNIAIKLEKYLSILVHPI